MTMQNSTPHGASGAATMTVSYGSLDPVMITINVAQPPDDDTAQGWETCDGPDLRGETCLSRGYLQDGGADHLGVEGECPAHFVEP